MKIKFLPFRKGRKKDSDKKNSSQYNVDLLRAAIAIGTVAILSVLLSLHLFPHKVSLVAGDVADKDIRAHCTVRYRDKIETERKRSEAIASVGKFYESAPNAQRAARAELENLFSVVENIRKKTLLSQEARVNEARLVVETEAGVDLSHATLNTLVGASQREFEEVEELAYRLAQETMATEIRNDEPRDTLRAKRLIDEGANRYFGSSKHAAAVSEIAAAVIRPNRILNTEWTTTAQNKAGEAVEPVWRQIMSGELVVSSGERIAPEHIEKFEALGLRNPRADYQSITSLCVFVSFLIVLVLMYLSRYQPQIYASTKLLALLALIVTLSTMGLRLGGSLLGVSLSGLQLGYLGTMCVVWAGMVLALLLNPQIAVLIVALLSITSGVIMNSELRFAAVTLVTGLVGIYSVANIRDRRDEWRAMFAIMVTYIAMVWIVGGISNDAPKDMLRSSVWGALIAAAAMLLFRIGTVALERPFGILTHIALLELADANRPLLRRLAMEAPGTYAHSIAVGQLAATAAEAVGADALFARVASYYHDIGKIRRPHFFVENQRVENAHDRLSPSISALVVTSHIKDGLELAKEYGLPESLQKVIVQHHGTSLAQYFYSQACTDGEPTSALERQFRYDGPKPATRESGIVMLADIVEAASRSLETPTQPRLEALVDKVINDRIADGQLDESELTFADISKIKQVFTKTLVSRLHARIEYPEATPGEEKTSPNNGDSSSKRSAAAGEHGKSEEKREEATAG